ncbi:MAG: 2-dehydro-3-deoxygalactonokinase [Rhodospirillaceae bacterium]|nr:2-dehydro-3-deoxygalactonokinase [Rhodospirillaceae bacterium]
MPSLPAWIAVDWGTSNLRCWAMSADDQVLGEAQSDRGMASLLPEEFETALLDCIAPWLGDGPPVRVIACGMVGARQGWREAPYSIAPCPPHSARARIEVACRDRRVAMCIVGGVAQHTPCDVMRGEETQIAGLLADLPEFDGVACLPGTHCKWVRIAEGQIRHFHTFMTGELFNLLATRSVLRFSVTSEAWDEAAFLAAVAEAAARPETVPGLLFPLRAASLLGDVAPSTARARLSGLLIGGELAAARDLWQATPVVMIGADRLARAYCAAAAALGGNVTLRDSTALTLAGLARARALAADPS